MHGSAVAGVASAEMTTLVRDRMTSPPRTVPAAMPLPELTRLLEAAKVSALPVVDEERLVGIVSTTDLVRARASGGLTADRAARDCMTRDVVSVRETDPLDEAARRMVAARVHRLVVVDEAGHAVGVLSTRDLLRDVVATRVATPIASVMTADPITIDIGDTIDLAVQRLAESNVHGLVVVEGMRPTGVFTHAEALAGRALPPALRSRPVEEVMSYETICLDAETPIHRAAAHAISMSVRRLLVVSNRDLVGILSCLDLVGVVGRASALAPPPA